MLTTVPEQYRADLGASPSRPEAMVRWRVGELLKARGWTAYKLVQESELPTTTVYRIAKSRGQVKRVDGQTLDALCGAFGVGPGELLEWSGEKRKKG